MTMTKESLQAEMERLLEAGDEKVFEAFVLEHFTELPEAVQSKVLMTFASQTLEKETGDAAIATLRQEGLQALGDLHALRSSISDSARS